MPIEYTPKQVRPGEGLSIDRQPLGSIKAALKEGTYVIDPAVRQTVRSALTDQLSKDAAKAILSKPGAKTFMNAYASIITERMWHPYTTHVTGETMGIYTVSFDKQGKSSLTPLPSDSLTDLPSSQIADVLATSNEGIMTHYITEQFSDGKTPSISNRSDKDREYLEALKEMTALGIQTGAIGPLIPKEAGTPAGFVTTGLRIIRTHIFGLPNLIDAVTKRYNINLTPDQHRNSLLETMRGSIVHYYQPTAPLVFEMNSQLIDPESGALKPESWTDNSNPDKLIVFPNPEIISAIHEQAKGKEFPIQTGCPAFSGRVTTVEAPELVIPLPRSLPELALQQLDRWYYPKLRREIAAREAH